MFIAKTFSDQGSYFLQNLENYRQAVIKKEISLAALFRSFSLQDEFFDQLLGIDTKTIRQSALTKTTHQDAVDSISSGYLFIGKLINFLKPYKHLKFVDVGCGTGQVLCAMQADGFGHLIGVEPNSNAISIAKKNVVKNLLKDPLTKVDFFEGDILDFNLNLGNIFYLYWPFQSETSVDFLSKLRISHSRLPREIFLIIYGQIRDEVKNYFDFLSYHSTLDHFVVFSTKELRN